ncbi:TPA: hypothetical protein N0F65_006324 [Lagenidium giganteum]|uniref:Uncharacterized protein n=1 Tax=Lagenidium giganteum TaxID=4803 RepID=A0AAV2YR92_9STRA|nr:TPA: hypothetical protein N0F65_006324 [Lagenidium giganteum]
MYKYDTTSVVWRAFARFFQLPSFPECFLYNADCDNNVMFSSKVWFQFVDDMTNAAAMSAQRQSSVVLRTQSKYLDRIHHWLFPHLFVRPCARKSYFYLREAMLFTSCFVPRGAEERYARADPWRRFLAALHLFARIPSQCIVYGSTIPICYYAIAHFIDAPMTYEMVAQASTPPMGKYKFDVTKFAYLVTSQMRNMWFLAIVRQLLHLVFLRLRQWSAPKGILGLPLFLLGIWSCLSMTSQHVCSRCEIPGLLAGSKRMNFRFSSQPQGERCRIKANDLEELTQHLKRQRAHRSTLFDKRLPLPRLFLLVNVVSYALACSDVLRSGLGQHKVNQAIEPNTYQYYGPWNYSVRESLWNASGNASDDAPVWMYKYDTTSVVWRAFARFFQLPSFPECFLYNADCDNNVMFSSKVWFQFVDDMTNAAAMSAQRQSSVVLRTQSKYLDRIHHWLFPHLFVRPTHMDITGKSDMNPSAAHSDRACQSVGIVWLDIMRQLMAVQLRFPGLDVDLTLLSSAEDVQVCKGGIAYIGRRKADVSSIIRVRNCTDNESGHICRSVFIKDHRYQVAIFTTNAIEFYRTVSVLRIIGQSYFYLRVMMLFVSCYMTRAAEECYLRAGIWSRLRAALHLFACIPSQCIVYGSAISVACYAIAHLIDAPMTYEMVAQSFTTPMGNYNFDAKKFAFLAANQMRNTWFLAFVMQVVHCLSLHLLRWTPPKGILGTPEFLFGILSCLSMVSQLRLLSLRDSRVLSYQQVNKRMDTAAHKFSLNSASDGNMLLEGAVLDAKFFMCLLAVLSMLVGAAHFCEWHRYRATNHERSSFLLPRMAVPYTAGIWWSTLAFSVSWGGTLFPVPKAYKAVLSMLWKSQQQLSRVSASIKSRRKSSVVQFVPELEETVLPQHSEERSKFFQREMTEIHMRSPDIDSLVALINLVALSDPVTYVRLRLWRGHVVHYFKNKVTRKVFAMPAAAATCSQVNSSIRWDELVHLRSRNTTNMTWSDIIHVG